MSQREKIVAILKEKSILKQVIYDNTYAVFIELKEILQEYAVEVNELLDGQDKRIKMVYQDRGKFEAQLQIASDVLLFSMHTNVFVFDRDNIIWRNSYVEKNRANAYCGVVNIYNFLSDSLRYNRNEDEGYLIGRLFVNREKEYLVEGKRQVTARHDHFGQGAINSEAIIDIVESAISYAVAEFDLLVPPFDVIKKVSVEQMNTKIEHSRLSTGKRLGYQYRSDDV
ncbi:MAG: hypothetical protein RR005_05030 [Mucinivorans sp.]